MKKRNMMMVLLIAITLLLVVVNMHHLQIALAKKWPVQKENYNNSVGLDIQTGLMPGVLIRIY